MAETIHPTEFKVVELWLLGSNDLDSLDGALVRVTEILRKARRIAVRAKGEEEVTDLVSSLAIKAGRCRLWGREVTRAISEAMALPDLRSSMRRVRNLALTVI
jgi:hypothetical protein